MTLATDWSEEFHGLQQNVLRLVDHGGADKSGHTRRPDRFQPTGFKCDGFDHRICESRTCLIIKLCR